MVKNTLEGIEDLRRFADISTHTTESVWDGFTVFECVNILAAMCSDEQPYDIYADALTREELKYAAKHGKCSAKCLKRLERIYG